MIDGEAIHKFIPEDAESTQLATLSTGGSHSFESEREILYKILYELRGNVNDLRREMNSLRKQIDATHSASVPSHDTSLPSIISSGEDAGIEPSARAATIVQDAVAEEISEPESLNLEDIGRQMVEKALERNGGNRKKAAKELGISDRTLYRRIKQYGLDK